MRADNYLIVCLLGLLLLICRRPQYQRASHNVGLAVGVSGIVPVRDHRGIRDLYGRKVKVTQTNVVDDLASSAHLLMGETKEQIGPVIVRNAPVLLREDTNSRSARLAMRRCLIASNFNMRGR